MNRRIGNRFIIGFCAVLVVLHSWGGSPALGSSLSRLASAIGKKDAILVADPDGKVLVSKHAGKLLIPASTLKVLTSLMALETLGSDFKYATRFFLDKSGNLKIKGYGDPLLISEVLDEIAGLLHPRMDGFNDLILDDSWFAPFSIPGVTSSLNPYDSPNGALCVNFNTVFFKRSNGIYTSAEPQTPLLPMALKRIRRTGLNRGRIIFSSQNKENLLYAGRMFRYFFDKHGILSNGTVRSGRVREGQDKLVFEYTSRFRLADVISKLMEHSNNFIANQLLATMGVKTYGPPANLEKGVRFATTYVQQELGRSDVRLTEGSGISRDNRITAEALMQVLEAFEPWHHLMPGRGATWYKSGTLSGISTRAGFIKHGESGLYRFVVFFNSRGRSAERMADRIVRALEK